MENWDDYRYFLAVMREGNISSAAAKMHVNHTTVSRRIAALETRLDVRLFDRRNTGFTPTTEAAILFDAAQEVEAGAGKISRLSLSRDTRLTGVLRVTTPWVILNYLLSPVLSDFTTRYPDVDLRLDSSENFANLVNREADIAVRVTSSPLETLHGFRLADTTTGLYASPQFLKKNDVTADTALQRNDLNWIAQKEEISRTGWRNQYFPKGRMACGVDKKPAAIAASLADLGIIDLPIIVGDQENRLVRLKGYEAKSDKGIWVLFHRDLKNTARVREFVSTIRKTKLGRL